MSCAFLPTAVYQGHSQAFEVRERVARCRGMGVGTFLEEGFLEEAIDSRGKMAPLVHKSKVQRQGRW